MSGFEQIEKQLTEFWQFPYHNDPVLAQKLSEVQAWQRGRIHRTHEALFSPAKHQAMGKFLIDQLYGGDKFNSLASMLERMVKKAEKLQKFVPNTAIETGLSGATEAITAIRLDMQLAQYLLSNDLPVNEANMITAYQQVNAKAQRVQQIADLKAMCYRSDKYLKSFILQKAFSLAKSTAYKHNMQVLYDFIDEGFQAIKPIKSMGEFIEPFCAKELQIIDNVHAGKANPFDV
ncbi:MULTISPECIES: FFLEELY motif protein [unclassified Moraxella]|uniref:FFLEELY motif protein n=1 Tax=unclassified Moraxella TaxID=2685852 RepID=UPI003AF72D35